MTLVSTLPDATRRAESRARPASHSLLDTLRLWRRRARERAELARFSERELHDIGLSRADALQEIGKPMWRP